MRSLPFSFVSRIDPARPESGSRYGVGHGRGRDRPPPGVPARSTNAGQAREAANWTPRRARCPRRGRVTLPDVEHPDAAPERWNVRLWTRLPAPTISDAYAARLAESVHPCDVACENGRSRRHSRFKQDVATKRTSGRRRCTDRRSRPLLPPREGLPSLGSAGTSTSRSSLQSVEWERSLGQPSSADGASHSRGSGSNPETPIRSRVEAGLGWVGDGLCCRVRYPLGTHLVGPVAAR
jgi:hypothetical protein